MSGGCPFTVGGVSLVESSMKDRPFRWWSPQYCSCPPGWGVWVWNLEAIVGWGVVAHCWALGDQTPRTEVSSGTVVALVAAASVGLVFVNWIVDASIDAAAGPVVGAWSWCQSTPRFAGCLGYVLLRAATCR